MNVLLSSASLACFKPSVYANFRLRFTAFDFSCLSLTIVLFIEYRTSFPGLRFVHGVQAGCEAFRSFD